MHSKPSDITITFLKYSPPKKVWKPSQSKHKHLKERFKERHGVIITDEEIISLITNIKEKLKNEEEARKVTQRILRLIVRNSARVTKWKALIKKDYYIVVYDELMSIIKTVLPKEGVLHRIHITEYRGGDKSDQI